VAVVEAFAEPSRTTYVALAALMILSWVMWFWRRDRATLVLASVLLLSLAAPAPAANG
jgi:hypothetical protein